MSKYLGIGLVVLGAYWLGNLHATQNCPEYARLEAKRQAAIDADVKAAFATASAQDTTCQDILGRARAHFEDDDLLLQEDLSR